jgi:hypothetical protein
MIKNSDIRTETNDPSEEDSSVILKPYEKPELKDLGDLRTLTLGGTPGAGDSGFPGLQNFPH